MNLTYVIAILASTILLGIVIIAFGEVLLPLREIALNTRPKESEVKEAYKSLPLLSTLLFALGILSIIGGIFASVIVLQ